MERERLTKMKPLLHGFMGGSVMDLGGDGVDWEKGGGQDYTTFN